MNIIRIYDDGKKFYNNINWQSLCRQNISVEYCTLKNKKQERIVVNEINESRLLQDWNLEDDNMYYVLLDTRWERTLMDQIEELENGFPMPKGLINQLKDVHIIQVIVYTLYGERDAQNLADFLRQDTDLSNKLENQTFKFGIFDPDKTLITIQEVLSI